MGDIVHALLERFAISDSRPVRVAVTVFLAAICLALLTIPLWARLF